MKKLLILSVVLLLFVNLLSGKSVSISQSKKVLYNFLKYKNHSEIKIKSESKIKDDNLLLAYVYQLKPNGFVVISADDIIYPIMAYSFRDNLIENDDNLIYEMLIYDIRNRLKHSPENLKTTAKERWDYFLSYSQNGKDTKDYQQWPAEGCTQTDGWVETTWNQTGVFNRFCPLDGPNQRSVVGCVATAMSMIIDFHHYVGNVQFSDADDYTSGWDDQMHIDDDYQERDYPSFPELNEYLVVLNEHYENNIPLTNDDKSALCFAAGIATHMIYGANGSGTWVSEVQTGLLNKFGFSSADYVDNIDNQFYQDLADNMKSMKPAELAIYTSGWNNGHAIICDGYNTNNYFHLNYGWGTSNNTCWYSLPEGMPYNYSILANAVINIEGGDVPVHITGNVSLSGDNPEGVYIRLEGDKIYEAYVNGQNGDYEIPAVEAGSYLASAIKEGENLYYQEFEVTINGSEQVLNFNLAQYNALSVTIQAPVSPMGANVQLYKNGEIAYSGVCNNESGTFSIPYVLPGQYLAKASLQDDYFATTTFSVTPTNQSVSISLNEYPSDYKIGYHNYPTDKWYLINNYTLGCGIKLSGDFLATYQNVPISGVSFKSPISSGEGTIFIQLWEGNTLMEQKEITDFGRDEWISATFDNFYLLDENKTYYVGYKITSENGYFVYYDNGPRVFGKGAFYRTTSWNEVPTGVLNANFCIEAIFLSQNYSSISGTIEATDNYPNLEEGIIRAGDYIGFCNGDGSYQIKLNSGIYDVTAYLPQHIPFTISQIEVGENSEVQNIDFLLEYGTFSNNDNIVQTTPKSVVVYPNPFKIGNSAKSKIVFDLKGDFKNPIIKIYNLKGQSVHTISDITSEKAVWNIKKEEKISAGLYFYKVSDESKQTYIDKFIIVK